MTSKTIGSMPADELLGLLIDLATKLRKGAISIAQFKIFLQGQNPFGVPPIIQLGTFKATGHLMAALDTLGGYISPCAEEIMSKPEFTLAETKRDVELVVTSGSKLGFTESKTLQEIYERATSEEFGYMLCPPEVGPQLRLQYLGQPKDEHLLVGMDPIADSRADLRIFSVGHNEVSNMLLNATFVRADYTWNPKGCWVFLRPRKK